jgi:hypothetical protein
MKKLSLLSISLLMTGNAYAMDVEVPTLEPAQEPTTPRTRFLRKKLSDLKSSAGYAIITQKLLARQTEQLGVCHYNLRSGVIDYAEYQSQVAKIKSTMPPHSQVEPLTEYLRNDGLKRALLLTVIDAEEKQLRDNLATAEAAFMQSQQALNMACSDSYTNRTAPQEFDSLTKAIAEECIRIKLLNSSLYKLEELRKL